MREFMKRVAASIVSWALILIFIVPFLPQKHLLPAVGEQIQLLIKDKNESDIKKVIQNVAVGYGEGTVVIISEIRLLGLIAVLIGFIVVFSRSMRHVAHNTSKIWKIIAIGIYLSFSFYTLYLINGAAENLTIQVVAMKMNKTYERNLTIVAPYISSQEEKELNSMWALVKDREDIQQIDKRFISLFEKNNLTVEGRPSEKPK